MTTNAATWTREDNSPYREDGSTWTLTVDGREVGHVESSLENLGSAPWGSVAPRWAVHTYGVVVYGQTPLEREFLVQGRNPRSVLAEAKRFVLSHA
jgi:hypothetical protein